MILDILDFAHHVLRHHIQTGDTVLDGTAGNGHDTLFLAQCVGEHGRVFAFDIQQIALERTAQRLTQYQYRDQVQLIHASHENLTQWIHSPLSAAIFNFGYLPRGDKNITTQAHSSIIAIKNTLNLLKNNGLLVAVLYSGHEAGMQEKNALMAFFATLPSHQFHVAHYGFVNRHRNPPTVILVKKCTQP